MPSEILRVGVCQLNYKICDFGGNVSLMEQAAQEARDADLLVFSELCLSGYHPLDLVEGTDFLQLQSQALDRVLSLSRRIAAALVIGLVTRNPGAGKSLHNSLIVIRDGQVLLTYHKQLLPTYDVFDERRYFEPGPHTAAVLEICGHRIGFLICEDAWNDEGHLYAVNPISAVAEHRVDLLININASPSHLGKRRHRHEIFGAVCKRYGVALVYSNQVGGNDQLVYDGASFALNRKGEVVEELPRYESATKVFTFAGDFRQPASPESPRPAQLSDEEFFYRQAIVGLRDYARKVGFARVIVGTSGG